VLFLPAWHSRLTSVRVFNGWFPHLARVVPAVSAAASGPARTPAGGRVLRGVTRLAAGAPGGPDEGERARTHVTARAAGRAGQTLAEVHTEGPSIYTLTGELLALAARMLADGAATQPGVLGPLDAFGLDRLESRCGQAGLVRTPR
jgi:hypothetical protein